MSVAVGCEAEALDIPEGEAMFILALEADF